MACVSLAVRHSASRPALSGSSAEPSAKSSTFIVRASFIARFEHLDRLAGHYRRNRMLIYELRMAIAPQQDAKVIEPCHHALQLYTIHEKNRQRHLVFSDIIQERVLQVLCAFCRHDLT